MYSINYHCILPVCTASEDPEKQDVLGCQHLSPYFLCIFPVKIVYIGECPAHACKEHYAHGGKSEVKELSFQRFKRRRKFRITQLQPVKPVYCKKGCSPETCRKVVDKSYKYC